MSDYQRPTPLFRTTDPATSAKAAKLAAASGIIRGHEALILAILHRVGPLAVGETSVFIAVASAHRREALAACAWAIDRVKKLAPIWKKEFYQDGASWIEGPDDCGSKDAGAILHPPPDAAVRPGGA